MKNSTSEQLKPRVILGVAAHPDDLEFGVSGSVAKWVSEGADVYYLILTNGDKGSDDRSLSSTQLRDLRRKEQLDAAEILGVKKVFFLDYEDGELEVTMQLKKDIVRVIRQTKPDLVYTMDPTMTYSLNGFGINHTDHRAAGQATLDAVFPLARDHLSFPELLREERLDQHKVKTVLLTNFDMQNYYVDISEFIETKLAALAGHASQLSDKNKTLSEVKKWASDAGVQCGVQYAESFVRLDLRE